jgi:hypothetical protein
VSNEPLISGGYIILSRKLIESEIWDKPPLYLKVWIYLLTRAQHKEFRKLKRGQLFVSIPEIQDACSWYVGFRKERPTKDQIYQIIDWLRKPNEAVHEAGTKATMITTTKATQGLLINIDNYWFYQNPKNYESNDEANDEKVMKATREQREPNNINKNVKNAENEKKENTSRHKYEICDYEAAEHLLKLMLENNPAARKPDLKKWANEVRLMRERDNRSIEDIHSLIKWTQQDSFWKNNILSISKLRTKWDQLVLKAQDQKGKKQPINTKPLSKEDFDLND